MNVSNDPSMTSPSSTERASGACDGDDTLSTDKLMKITRMMRPCVCVIGYCSDGAGGGDNAGVVAVGGLTN